MISIVGGGDCSHAHLSVDKGGFMFSIHWSDTDSDAVIKVRVCFHGHYREPPLDYDITVCKGKGKL